MRILICALLVGFTVSAHAADRLPKSMLGRWTTDLATCSEQSSELRMTVEPRMVLFYEHGYEIRRVVRLKDGSLRASGYHADDSGRTRDSITLKLVEPDKLLVGGGGEVYLRCKK